MQKIKNFLAIIIIGVALAGGVTFATAIWQDTDWIDAGEIISAEKIRDNFDYLFSIAREDPPICTGSGALQWDGEDWGCTTTTAAGVIITETHTQEECVAEGGSMYETPDGYVCKIAASSCPAGWSQYESWSTTAPQTCMGTVTGSCQAAQCTTSSHGFSSNTRETCEYPGRMRYRETEAGPECQSWVGNYTCYATITEVGCI